jgi:hypothetical protein
MRSKIEIRLHRVKIISPAEEVRCPHSAQCDKAESGMRCNIHFSKCGRFKNKHSKLF